MVITADEARAIAICHETGDWGWFREWDGAWRLNPHGASDEYRQQRQRRALQEIAKLDPDYKGEDAVNA